MSAIIPCILSGGAGSRLWPLSRQTMPKQFLRIFDGESLFQKTVERVSGEAFSAPLVIANEAHRFMAGEQLAEAGVEPRAIVLEPFGRNTAAPAALAALIAAETARDALVLLLPSDHLIRDTNAFLNAVESARPAAEAGRIVTFGITPDRAHTGYGYIRLGEGTDCVFDVAAFIEKPDKARAQAFLASGDHVWNSGIFLFSARTMLRAFEKHAPGVLDAVRSAHENGREDLDFLRLDADAFAKADNISIDYAIMEQADNIACVPMDPNWSDLGAWSAVWEILDKDEAGNSTLGEALFVDASDNLVVSDDAVVAMVGLRDVMVVSTKDAVLVAAKDKAEDVKAIVQRLDNDKRRETRRHRRVYRPWGWREEIAAHARYHVQEIEIKPGKSLSLQSHVHRAEHWVVVSGTLEIEIEGAKRFLSENQSAFVPIGAHHRLANPGLIPARLIEVQSGAHISEEDITRHDGGEGAS
ncbi:mannose-1-phosphate guanylyltransferase/mannose-6-phosphate isomerase [Rhizobiales bacterium]|uniref:mannose-1-phosphate guanylyltransferase/mannose-6-phosphate isomerase n=1 Tax=Hongsoonwoonella zoysiae TaxID=2821844 RepID=UPI001560564D|nr:mannose-1-phosphate guanylyltransferase/mannose-6-phosphate isomerase [Hongsoonwoonella zoysiae]NRG18558.1 mannose-1-phosphate guanylyltransferase/mannose-6-phosphate isomerase [Hongsoonwoonella zoysiae]